MSIPHFKLASISFVLILLSLFIPKTAQTKEEFRITTVGYPTPFVQQDDGGLSNSASYPRRYALHNPLEVGIKFLWGSFLLSWIVTFLSLEALWFLIQFRKGHLKFSEKLGQKS